MNQLLKRSLLDQPVSTYPLNKRARTYTQDRPPDVRKGIEQCISHRERLCLLLSLFRQRADFSNMASISKIDAC